jgi:Tfp pilus assembly protein PilF
MAAVVSVFALRPAGSAVQRSDTTSTEMTEIESSLRLPLRYRQDTSAYGSYLRGMTLRFNGGIETSRDTFAALVDREPLYAPGYAGLAHAYLLLEFSGWTTPGEGSPKGETAARKALALDSTVASGYTALGAIELIWRWNALRARQLIDRAVALDPGDPENHIVLGVWFRWQGDADSALAEARKAHELTPERVAQQPCSRRPALREAVRRSRGHVPADDQGLSEAAGLPGPVPCLPGRRAPPRRAGDGAKGRRSAHDSVTLASLPLATSDSERPAGTPTGVVGPPPSRNGRASGRWGLARGFPGCLQSGPGYESDSALARFRGGTT